MTTRPIQPDSVDPIRQELENLALSSSEPQIEKDLVRIVSVFGALKSISQMMPAVEFGRKERIFFVDFEEAHDAMAAANDLDCVLFGFSTVVVRVPIRAAIPSRASAASAVRLARL